MGTEANSMLNIMNMNSDLRFANNMIDDSICSTSSRSCKCVYLISEQNTVCPTFEPSGVPSGASYIEHFRGLFLFM